MKSARFSILAILILSITTATAEAGWLIYHEPEFQGTILDIDTKQPIEGAVIVAVYKKSTMGLGTGTMSSIINIRETLTDKEGNFRVPSYTTFIQPFSWKSQTIFIIFKPGYASIETGNWHFMGKELKKAQERGWPWTENLKYKLHGRGIVELPRLQSREERRNSKPSPAEDSEHESSWYYKKQKLLIKAIRDEWQYLYGEKPGTLYKWEDN